MIMIYVISTEKKTENGIDDDDDDNNDNYNNNNNNNRNWHTILKRFDVASNIHA